MDHIYYSKNVLDAGTLNNLQELCFERYDEIPTYNFALKTEEPKKSRKMWDRFTEEVRHTKSTE